MEISKPKRKNSRKKSNGKKLKTERTFLYLRPFIKAFFIALKMNFRIVLYSYFDYKAFQPITERFDEIFGESYFDGYLCFPTARKGSSPKHRQIRDFLSIEESRTMENCYFIDTKEEFCSSSPGN